MSDELIENFELSENIFASVGINSSIQEFNGYPFIGFLYEDSNDLTVKLLDKMFTSRKIYHKFGIDGDIVYCDIFDDRKQLKTEQKKINGETHTFINKVNEVMLRAIGFDINICEEWESRLADVGVWLLYFRTKFVLRSWIVNCYDNMISFNVKVVDDEFPLALIVPEL